MLMLVGACSDGSDEGTATATETATNESAASTGTAAATSSAEATSSPSVAPTSTSTAEATGTSAVGATSTATAAADPTANSTSSPEAGDNDYETEIEDFAFEQGITVTAGTAVRWENRDGVPHTVTADDSAFDSGPLQTNDTFEFLFEAAGTFAFHCNVHPSMTATITVQ